MSEHPEPTPAPIPAPDPADPEPPVVEVAPSAAERRARRRWLTLAEVLGIAGLLIAGLTLWNNIAMRRGQEADRVADEARSAKAAAAAAHDEALVTLEGAPLQGGKQLKLSDVADHRIQNVQLRFPPALGVPPHGSVLDLKIESDWIAKRVLALTDGGPDAVEGEIPVLITSSYWQGDKPVSDTAVYGLVFQTRGEFMSGRALRLRGLVLLERVKPGTGAAILQPRWEGERRRLAALKNG